MQNYFASNSSRVRLDDYICDLNLEISPGGYACQPLSNDGFAYMWAGSKATYGIRSGKVCFEAKISGYCDVAINDVDIHVVRVGWSTDSATLQLGEDKNSFGFGGTGKKSVNRKFANYGRRFEKGDVVGCYLAMENGWVDISYSVNGRFCGSAFKIRWMTDEALFPHILTKNCKVEVNFGQAPHPYFSLQPGYKLIDHTPLEFRIPAVRTPATQSDCEVIMMVGLPGVGKSTWAMNYGKIHPSKKYVILGTDSIIDKMRVLGLPRKNNFSGRWDMLIKQATDCFNVLLKKASNLPRNMILDQTNVYASARRRKVKQYREKGYTVNAMVLVPRDQDMIQRSNQRTMEEGKEVPESAVLDMKANFSLPHESENLFDKITFLELQRADAQALVEQYNMEAMRKGHRSNQQRGQGRNVNQTERNQQMSRYSSSSSLDRSQDSSYARASATPQRESGYWTPGGASEPPAWDGDTRGPKRPEESGYGPPEKLRRGDSPSRRDFSQRGYSDPYASYYQQDQYSNNSMKAESKQWDSKPATNWGGRPTPGAYPGQDAHPQARGDAQVGYNDSANRMAIPGRDRPQTQDPYNYGNVKNESYSEAGYPRTQEPDDWKKQNANSAYYEQATRMGGAPSYGDSSATNQASYQPRPPVKSEAAARGDWFDNTSYSQADQTMQGNRGGNYGGDNSYYTSQANSASYSQQDSYYDGRESYYSTANTSTGVKQEPRDSYNDPYNNQYARNDNYDKGSSDAQYNTTSSDPYGSRNVPTSQLWNQTDNSSRYDQSYDDSQQHQDRSFDRRNEQAYPGRNQSFQQASERSLQQEYIHDRQQDLSYGDQQEKYPPHSGGYSRDAPSTYPPYSQKDPYTSQKREPDETYTAGSYGGGRAPFPTPTSGPQGPMQSRGDDPGIYPPGMDRDSTHPLLHDHHGQERGMYGRDQGEFPSSQYGSKEPPMPRPMVKQEPRSQNDSRYGGRNTDYPPRRGDDDRFYLGFDTDKFIDRQPGDRRPPSNYSEPSQSRLPPPDPARMPESRKPSDFAEHRSDSRDRRPPNDGRDRSPRRERSPRDSSRSRGRPNERDEGPPRSGRRDPSSSRRGDDREDSRPRGSDRAGKDYSRDGSRSRSDRREDRDREHSRSRHEGRDSRGRSNSRPARSDSEKTEERDKRDDARSRHDERRSRDGRETERSSRDHRNASSKPPLPSGTSNIRSEVPPPKRRDDSPALRKDAPVGPPPQTTSRSPLKPAQPAPKGSLLGTPPAPKGSLLGTPPAISKISPSDKAGLSNQSPLPEPDPNTISKLESVDFDKLKASLATLRRQNLSVEDDARKAKTNDITTEGGPEDMDIDTDEPSTPIEHSRPPLHPRLPAGPRARRPPPPRMSLLGQAPGGPPGVRPPKPRNPALLGERPGFRQRSPASSGNFERPRRPLLDTPLMRHDRQVEEEMLQEEEAIRSLAEEAGDPYYRNEIGDPRSRVMRPRFRGPRPFGVRPPMRPPGMRPRMRPPGVRGFRPVLRRGAPPRYPMQPRLGLM